MIVTCTHCGQRAMATAAHAGRSVPCPSCRTTIHVSPLVPVEEMVAETSAVNSSPQPSAASSDPYGFSQDEYRVAASPVAQTAFRSAAPAPPSKLAAWLGCSDELHRERKRILFWWAVPFGVMNALLLVMHPFLFILSAPFSLVCFGGGILIFAEALYMPFWESRRFRWIRMMFSKETYRWIGMVWGGGWAVAGYGISTLALVLAIANWGLIFAIRANAPPVARAPNAEERWEAKEEAHRKDRDEFLRRLGEPDPEPAPAPAPEEPAVAAVPAPPPDPIPQKKVGWGKVFGEDRTPIDALKEVEHWIELRTANLELYRNKDRFNLGVAELDLKLAKRDLEFLRQLDPERAPPKSFMEAEVKLRKKEHEAARDNHRARSQAWVQEHFLENRLEESEVQQLERRLRRAEQYLSHWPVP